MLSFHWDCHEFSFISMSRNNTIAQQPLKPTLFSCKVFILYLMINVCLLHVAIFPVSIYILFQYTIPEPVYINIQVLIFCLILTFLDVWVKIHIHFHRS